VAPHTDGADEPRGDLMRSARPVRRLLAGAALVGVAGLIPLQEAAPGGSGAASAATLASDACGTVKTKADGSDWSCSFVDDFGGNELDGDKWLIGETAWSGFRTGMTCYVKGPKNLAVRRGALELTARREPRPFTCQSPKGDFATQYTGGHVTTRGRFSQTYGRFEVRAMFPTARTSGVHGGFWMYPVNHTYGAWPNSGEIDVAEWWSADPTLVLPSLHYSGRDWRYDSGWNCRVADVSSYHTYTVEWLPTEVSFFIDGSLCFTRTPTPDSPLVAPQPFDHPFNPILNMGVGGASGTNQVSSATELPGTYSVDYVKAWR
jgi:beta-glucanase (GH16 family)